MENTENKKVGSKEGLKNFTAVLMALPVLLYPFIIIALIALNGESDATDVSTVEKMMLWMLCAAGAAFAFEVLYTVVSIAKKYKPLTLCIISVTGNIISIVGGGLILLISIILVITIAGADYGGHLMYATALCFILGALLCLPAGINAMRMGGNKILYIISMIFHIIPGFNIIFSIVMLVNWIVGLRKQKTAARAALI